MPEKQNPCCEQNHHPKFNGDICQACITSGMELPDGNLERSKVREICTELFYEDKRFWSYDSVEQNSAYDQGEAAYGSPGRPKAESISLFNQQIGWHKHWFGIRVHPNLQDIQQNNYQYNHQY